MISPENHVSCTGESQYNLSGQLGGDSTLTTRGHRFARLLGEYVRHLPHSKLKVWTSWLTRTIQTASNISGVQERYALFIVDGEVRLFRVFC